LYVPEQEASDYRATERGQVVGVPQGVRGITKTRNWILDNANDDQVVFVDDDAKNVGWVELRTFDCRHHKMTERVLLPEFEKLFAVARGVGARIWGMATQSATRSVYPWAPFRFQSYVTASCMGIWNDTGIRFDEAFPVKEDYELCLRCIKEDGLVLSAQYFYWENAHWDTAGGCKDYRTQAMEEDCIRRLMALYPGYIRRVTRGGSEYSIQLDF